LEGVGTPDDEAWGGRAADDKIFTTKLEESFKLDTGDSRFFSLAMPLLIFWPRAGAFGAGAILVLNAQLLWCVVGYANKQMSLFLRDRS